MRTRLGTTAAPLLGRGGLLGRAGAGPLLLFLLLAAAGLELLHAPVLVVDVHRQVAQDVLVEPHLALELRDHRRVALELEERVVAVALPVDGVGKAAFALLLALGQVALARADDAL